MRVKARDLALGAALLSVAATSPGPDSVLVDLSGALSARDSQGVLACFTRDARVHYARVLEVARGGAGADASSGFSYSDRALARVLTRRAPELIAESKSLDALALRAARERDDWSTEMERVAVAAVETSTGEAHGMLAVDGAPVPIALALAREDGRWRIHRISSPLLASEAVRLSAFVLGVSEEQAIDTIVDRLLQAP
jgi:hypothetical protein